MISDSGDNKVRGWGQGRRDREREREKWMEIDRERCGGFRLINSNGG